MLKNIVWLNGMPRSGTSWLSQIFDSHPDVRFKLAPLFSYRFKNAVTIDSSIENWLTFFNNVYKAQDPFLDQTEKRSSGDYPVFINKYQAPNFLVIKDTRYHNLTPYLLEILPSLKFIHIIRNPCAVINSWIKADREFKNKGCTISKDWKTGTCRKTGEEEFWGFNDWVILTNFYLKLQENHHEKVMIVKYEDLVLNPKSETIRMFNFANLNYNAQTEEFIIKSQSENYGGDYSVYRNKEVKDKWKNELNQYIASEIYEDLKDTRLEQFLK